jgi:hypothetical protein
MKNLGLSFLTILIMVFSFSCKKDGTSNNATADVFVRSFMDPSKVISYNTVFSVTFIGGITAATAEGPGIPAFSLMDHFGDGTAFFKDSSMAAGGGYNHTPPQAGTYTFHVTFNDGSQKVFTNTLSSTILLPPVIDSLYKKPFGLDQSVRFAWEPVVGAQYYQIRLSCGQNVIQDWGLNMTPGSVLAYERLIDNFSNYLPGTILFEIRAVLYEGNQNYAQSISQNSLSIDL